MLDPKMRRRVSPPITLLCAFLIAMEVFGNYANCEIVAPSVSNTTISGLTSTNKLGDEAQAFFNPPQSNWTLQVLNVTGLTYGQRLCALTLQGIVNKGSPNMIYFVKDKVYEQQWIDYYRNEFNISAVYYSDLNSLIRANKNYIRGYVVYDPTVPGSQFIAATVSGLNDSITVSPDMIDFVKSEGISQDLDLRGKFLPGNTTAVYEWGYENLFPLTNHTLIGNMYYNGADDGYYDIYMQIMDYLVSQKAFIMGLSSTTEPDRTLKQLFLNGMDKFGEVFGWCGPDDYESVHVAQVSEAGETVICSFPESPNYSVHSRFSPSVYRQKTQLENLQYNQSKTYVTFIFSDGDALWTANSRYRNNWDSPLRGTVKIGWELGPALMNLAPDILDYYYQTQSPLDEFIGGAGGVGYFFADLIPQDELRQRLVIADSVMRDMDESSLWIVTHTAPPSEALLETYDSSMSARSFFEGYEAKLEPHQVLNRSVWFETKFPDMPIGWDKPWTELMTGIKSLAQSEQFIVVHVMPIEGVINKVYDIAVNLGSKYEVVLPSELAALKMQSVRGLSLSDLQDSVAAGANQDYFIYADPYRINRTVAANDIASGSIVFGMCVNSQTQSFDTNQALVSQSSLDKGRLLVHNSTVLMFGGPSVHLCVSYLEKQRVTPVYFLADSSSDGLHLKFVETSTETIKVDRVVSGINLDYEDYFVIMAFIDGNSNHVFISYGFDWKGTWGAGIYLKSIYPNIGTYINSYYIIHWVDENGDGVPQSNEMKQIAAG